MTDDDVLTEARALRRSTARLTRAFRGIRDRDSPTPAELSVLGTLYHNGPMATGELARCEGLKPQSVTRLVASLSARHFIERIVDESDRRRLVSALTAQGRRQLVREMQRRDVRLSRALSALSADDRAVLLAACVIIDRLGHVD